MTNAVQFGAPVQSIDVRSLDIETALMAVQTTRANHLETLLKDQMAAVQAKNDKIAQFNQILGGLNAMAAKFKPDAKAGEKLDLSHMNADEQAAWYEMVGGVQKQLVEAGFDTSKAPFDVKVDIKKGDLDGLVQQTRSQIDALTNTQQMDMLRLQSLSNKRNEAFEIMTNFVKKLQDNNNSIIGNMR